MKPVSHMHVRALVVLVCELADDVAAVVPQPLTAVAPLSISTAAVHCSLIHDSVSTTST
jgi:hypothetical protein